MELQHDLAGNGGGRNVDVLDEEVAGRGILRRRAAPEIVLVSPRSGYTNRTILPADNWCIRLPKPEPRITSIRAEAGTSWRIIVNKDVVGFYEPGISPSEASRPEG